MPSQRDTLDIAVRTLGRMSAMLGSARQATEDARAQIQARCMQRIHMHFLDMQRATSLCVFAPTPPLLYEAFLL